MCRCARTITRIGRHADKKHKEQDSMLRRQKDLCLMMQCYALPLCLYVCNGVYVCICVQAYERMQTDSCAFSPLGNDVMY